MSDLFLHQKLAKHCFDLRRPNSANHETDQTTDNKTHITSKVLGNPDVLLVKLSIHQPYLHENIPGMTTVFRSCLNINMATKQRRAELELEHLLNGEPPPIKQRKARKVKPDDHLKRAYGITLEEKQQMMSSQHNMCGICCTALDPSKLSTVAVDHCHTTGNVRGILCRNCNLLLGMARDNEQILLNAVQYLKASKM